MNKTDKTDQYPEQGINPYADQIARGFDSLDKPVTDSRTVAGQMTQSEWNDHADALYEEIKKGRALFDPSKLAIDFDPYRSFNSVDEAIAYCEKQPEPMTACMAITCANILLGEFGFASEVVKESQTMAVCCPDILPRNRA